MVKELKERKLAELVEVFSEDINSEDDDGILARLKVNLWLIVWLIAMTHIKAAEDKYADLKQKFDDFQANQQAELDELLNRNALGK